MSEKSKIEIEELLSALVDDEATERQKNEFIRLVRHDPTIADQLTFMQRQKQILGAMPVEAAPDSLAEDICLALERKQILGEVCDSAQMTVAGASHLFMRRMLTTAAMLLLPIGLLSFVVYEIIKPPTAGPAGYSSVDDRLAHGDSSVAEDSESAIIAGTLPFDGVLTFKTDQLMRVSDYAQKMFFDQGLISVTVPSRTEDVTTYHVTAPPENIAILIDSLKNVWPHCQQVALSVTDGTPGNRVDIPDIEVEQVKTLAVEDSKEMLSRLAGQYAVANTNKNSAFAMGSAPDAGAPDTLPLTIPILTGNEESTPNKIDPERPSIRLQIHIERIME